MAESIVPLRIKAQPKASYRERYFSEQDRNRNRSLRFIRADDNPHQLDYPTVELLQQWRCLCLYIRVTLVTMMTEQAPIVCVHPYPIDTPDLHVIKDFERNTLYFPISDDDFKKGQKSFRIIRKKLTQYQLRSYGELRILNREEKDIQRINDPTDARRLIDTYQLGKSQLIFSLAQLIDDNLLPVIYDATTVCSNLMSAITTTSTLSANDDDSYVRYAPQKGDWQGGDEILMVVPKIDKRKTCQVYFDHPLINREEQIRVEFIDSKTIAITTPQCPIRLSTNQSMDIPIVIIQSGEEIARVFFRYQSCDNCGNYVTNIMSDSPDDSIFFDNFLQ